MSANTVILLTFGAYMVLLLYIGWWGERRFGRSYDGFVTANKSLGGWVAAISSAASSESAWVMLGLSGRGYKMGVAGYWAAIGCTLGFVVASLLVVRQLRRSSGLYEVTTLGDYLEQALGDRRRIIRTLSSVTIVFFMLVYVVAQFVGAGKQVSGMHLFSYQGGVALGAVVIAIYVLLGGYAAVCWTDMIQGLLIVAVMVAFPLYALSVAGGLGPVVDVLRENNLTSIWPGGKGMTLDAFYYALGGLGIGIGYPGMPHSIIRFVTVRDDKEARDAAIISVVWGVLVLFGAVSLGIIGRVLLPDLADPEKILPAFTAKYFHPVIGGVILAAVSAAIMSTADSQLIMAATSAIHDLWYKLLRRLLPDRLTGPALTTEVNMTLILMAMGFAFIEPKTQHSLYGFPVWYVLLFVVWYLLVRTFKDKERARIIQTRAFIGLLALIALRLALIKPQVIDTFVLFAWGALGSSFTPVILLTLHWKRFRWQGALAAFVLGPATVVLWKVSGLSATLYEMIPATLVAFAAAILVTLLTGEQNPPESADKPSLQK